MKFILPFLILIGCNQALAQQGGVFKNLSLLPTTLPTFCKVGDIRTNTSSNNVNSCTSSNTWTEFSFNGLSPMTTLGDTIYGGSSGVGTRLPGNTSATRKYYGETGTGSLSAAPSWTQPAFNELTGAINLATQTSGDLAVSHLNGGNSATSSTFWRGDGTWATATSVPVTVGTAGTSEHVNRARILGDGSCTINSQSGSWLSSPVHNGAGDCTFTIAGGEYSAAPACVCTGTDGTQNRICSMAAPTQTSLPHVFMWSGGADDEALDIICMGPH